MQSEINEGIKMATKKFLYDTKKGSHGGIEQKSIKDKGGCTQWQKYLSTITLSVNGANSN